MTTTPAAGVDVAEDQVGEQGRLAAARGSHDVEVVAGVGDGEGDRPAGAGLGVSEHLRALRAGRCGQRRRTGEGGWRGDGLGSGPGQAGHGLVGGQMGEGG